MENEKRNELLKGIYDSLTGEQKEKVKACKTMDELMKLAGQEGIELPDEALDAVAGGAIFWDENARQWVLIRDSDGKELKRMSKFYDRFDYEEAEEWAERNGQSRYEITTEEELKALRGGCG